MSQTQIRGNKQIKSGSITNVEVAANAAIALSKVNGGLELQGRIGDLEQPNYISKEVPSGSVNGSNAAYTLANTPVVGSEEVYLNGLLVKSGSGYTISGGVITFSEAPQSGDELYVNYAQGDYFVAPGGAAVGGGGGGGGLEGGGGASQSVSYGTVSLGDGKFSASDEMSIAILTNGSLCAWGANSYGQLGLGDTTTRRIPTRIGSDTNWSKISSNKWRGEGGGRFLDFCVGLKSNGTLWSWGANDQGQLGLGDSTNRNSPVQIGSDTNWSQIQCAAASVLAIKSNGTLWSWGYNGLGDLGLGDASNRNSPTQIGSASDWASISGGGSFCCAIKTNGTLWSWGYNAYGQLGHGDTSTRYSPTQIGEGSTWSKVAVAGGHVLGLKADGTLWAWGYNGGGKLGLGDTTNRSVPTQVGNSTDWSDIGVGQNHSFAVKTDGTLWAWGLNDYNQVGNGTQINQSSPVKISTETNWSKICGGRYHTLASKTDGTLLAWGHNGNSELGDGTNLSRPGPAKGEVHLSS